MFLPLLLLQLIFYESVLGFSFSCPASDPKCLSSFFNSSSILNTFLGDDDSVILQNGLKGVGNGTACPKMAVIFARGTAEPGNVGILTGPAFFTAIAVYMNGTNQLAIQGVDYDADAEGFLAGGDQEGANTMASLINSTQSHCPNAPLILSGYSQGAQLVHLAAASLPARSTSKLASIILFGDPKNGTAVPNIDSKRVLSICHAGDQICQGKDHVSLDSLDYAKDAGMAAMFIMGCVANLGITSQSMRVAGQGGIG